MFEISKWETNPDDKYFVKPDVQLYYERCKQQKGGIHGLGSVQGV